MDLNLKKKRYTFLSLLLFTFLISPAHAAVEPVGIHCPCEIVRINQTKAEVSFSLVMQPTNPMNSQGESGDLSLLIAAPDQLTIFGSSYYPLGEVDIPSVSFDGSLQKTITVDVPLNWIGDIELYVSLILDDADGYVVDQVNFLEIVEEYTNYGGTVGQTTSKLMINSELEFEHDATTFSLNIPSMSSTDKRSSNDLLTLKIAVFESLGEDGSASYYEAATADILATYDEYGEASITVSGDLNFSLESVFQEDPEFRHVTVMLSRFEESIMFYRVETFGQESLDSLKARWSNVNTLLDSDGDGISDFDERIVGSDVNSVNMLNDTVIEVAFTVGSSANSNFLGGSNLDASIAQQVTAANTAFQDVGLDIEIRNVGTYILGDDSNLTGSAAIDDFADRTGIFVGLDAKLNRQPDLFIHYSTKAVAETGGIATLGGIVNDGIMNYENLYADRSNMGVVAIDNSSLTLVHEIGHLMGLSHSRRQADGNPISAAFPWAVGYGLDSNFSTIMAYESAFDNASGMRFFSTPNRYCGGPGYTKTACGIDYSDLRSGAHSVKALKATALQISGISNGLLPVIILEGDDPVYIPDIDYASELKALALDREDGDITSSITFEVDSINNNNLEHDFEQVYSVVDSDGNVGRAIRKIIIASDTTDTDGDGIFDFLDEDDDNDGVIDELDAFPLDPSEQVDTDSDGIGDNADTDDDGDGVDDGLDAFPLDATESLDTDGDGIGNNVDTDDDNDGVDDIDDAFPIDSSETVDTDGDGIGNNADNDDDGDGVDDSSDAFPLLNYETTDTDGDGIGNNADLDDDNDGVDDLSDAYPLISLGDLADTDMDGRPDECDSECIDLGMAADNDDDGDGVEDEQDLHPLDRRYSVDSDGDGMPDAWEIAFGLDPNNPSDASSDQDGDGISALEEFLADTFPSGSIDIDSNGQYDALTDGLLLLRGMFGLDGDALVSGTLAPDAFYTSGSDIRSRLDLLEGFVDIDGNGEVDALTDGLLILRFLFGLEGNALTNGVVAPDATRTSYEIETYLKSLIPAS